jgi:peptidoglycan/xylan/chitin deacetylase (PgdA/CDA1 family)
MNWDELRDLRDRGHLIGCHTASHRRFRGAVDAELANREIRDAKLRMERELGQAVDGFAWVGGELDTYSAVAEAAIRAAGFSYAFTTQSLPFRPGNDPLRMHRTIVDADMDFGLFRMKLAGLSDLAHLGGRAETLRRLRMPATP